MEKSEVLSIESSFHCKKCGNELIRQSSLNSVKTILFSLVLTGSFFVMIIFILIALIRKRKKKKTSNDTDIGNNDSINSFTKKSEDNYNLYTIFGLILPQTIYNRCTNCKSSSIFKEENGDLEYLLYMFSILIAILLIVFSFNYYLKN